MNGLKYGFCGLLIGSVCLLGCGKKEEGQPIKKGQEVEHHEEPEGPHGGHVLHPDPHDTEVHLEVTFDGMSREVAIYPIVEKDEKFEAYALDVDTIEFHYLPEDADEEQELVFNVVADADPKGSKFVLAGDKLPMEIEDEEDLAGHIHLDLDGNEFVFNMHHDHDHEGGHHDDEDEDHDED